MVDPDRSIRTLLMLAVAPILALAAGCTSDITDPGPGDADFILGLIQARPDFEFDPQLSAVATGDTLIVGVDTYGSSGCRSKGHLRVELDESARRLTVSPFDRYAGQLCFSQGETFEYADTLRLTPGSWTVVFRGRADLIPHPQVITVEQTVEIPGAS